MAERDFSTLDVLVIYLDGIQFGEYHVLAAVAVDAAGKKHVLGVRAGASENATVTMALLEDLIARGLRPDRRRLFVIDGAKALRWAATAFMATEKNYRRVTGYDHLWMLKAHLDRDDKDVAEMQKVG